VVEIRLPALRERSEDIPVLAQRFLDDAGRVYRRPAAHFTAEALAALQDYPWPGNVRELKNVIERALILCRGESVSVEDLPLLSPSRPRITADAMSSLEHLTLADLERALIRRVLDQSQGNVTKAAQALGLSRAALYRRLEKFGIEAHLGVDAAS
jgi:two-component system, NtrC family, response regulator